MAGQKARNSVTCAGQQGRPLHYLPW